MKQQAGIGILLALTTAMCWGALPIAMKQVLEVMEPPTVVFYRFLMAGIGLGLILAIKGKLPPMGLFRKPRWLVLLAIATGGLFGNFILFSSSLQYLSPTASQVIGQLSPVGMMVASVLILKEKMRGTQIIGAIMLLCGLVMFFNTSLIEIFTRLTDYTWGVIFGVGAATQKTGRRGDGLGQLRRGSEGSVASSGLATDPLFAVHFMYYCAAAAGEARGAVSA
ncbi:Permease of the drug/metabolite transporter (DMT) superfamily [Cronobacter malonaticus 507]|nr:Permease of the drug/metabolite transporter (DMT) superfamily [Cronobacter malonaticus 507]